MNQLNEIRRLAGLPLQEEKLDEAKSKVTADPAHIEAAASAGAASKKNVTLVIVAQESLKRIMSQIDKLTRDVSGLDWTTMKDVLPKELLSKVETLIELRDDLDKAEQILKAYWNGQVQK